MGRSLVGLPKQGVYEPVVRRSGATRADVLARAWSGRRVAFALVLVLVLVIGTVAIERLWVFTDVQGRVTETLRATAILQSTEDALAVSESAYRKYLTTSDPSDLETAFASVTMQSRLSYQGSD